MSTRYSSQVDKEIEEPAKPDAAFGEKERFVRVLMIEDDRDYFSFVHRLLARSSEPKFAITNVRSLAETSQSLSWEIPDVILLDLGLLDSNGLITLERVRDLASDVPIIVLTGRDAQDIGVQAVGLGAQDYLVKHEIGNNSLIRCIRYTIGRRKFEESTLRLTAIRDFTSMLAHDLQVPLVGSTNVFEALLAGQFGQLTQEQTQVVLDLQKSNKDQLVLVQKLLEVYRYETGVPRLDFLPQDIKHLISECAGQVSKNHSSSVPIVAFVPDSLPAVMGDEAALRRLFTSLIDNAVKFSDGVGEVRIHSELVGSKMAVHIHNYGSLIPEDVQTKLFQNFWQGVPGKSYVAQTGTGLYLCHCIANLHHGRITFHSTAKEGTTVRVILPVILST